MGYTVGEIARMAGVTVRALHHYDRIGLLSPSGRTPAGYRSYDESDVDRLQHVLWYRELGFPLDEIASLVDDPHTDRVEHLRRQRELLATRIDRLGAMVAAVDRELEAVTMGFRMDPRQRLAVFGTWRPREGYAEDAERRWGDTPQWRQAQDRMAERTEQDWLDGRDRGRAWVAEFTAAVTEGVAPEGERGMAVAEAHRALLGEYFDCAPDMHLAIVATYGQDPEQFAFAVRPDEQVPGMVGFLTAAAAANAARHR